MRAWARAALLGAGVTGAALAFGSRPLGVVGVGLLLASALTQVWAALVRGPVLLVHDLVPAPATEGDRVTLAIEARRASRVPVGSIAVQGSLGRGGSYACRLRGRRRTAAARLDLGALPRGVFPLSSVDVVLGDVLGLASVSVRARFDATTVVVRPRLVPLDAVFSDASRVGGDGRRLLLRRSAGFDFHSVREYEQGESLRRVHWPSSARRGRLMVKELEDALQDRVVVLLDCDPAGAAGEPPDSSFDVAVRAAGSILRAVVERGRTAALVTTGRARAVVPVRAVAAFDAALGALAAAEPDALDPLGKALRVAPPPVGHAGELVVVTASLEPGAVDALLGLGARQLVAVVWVDAPSFAERPTRAHPGVLRLAAAGVPVAVVRRRDDLGAALGARRSEAVANA